VAKTLFGSREVAEMEAEELIGLDEADIEDILEDRKPSADRTYPSLVKEFAG